MDDFLDLGSRVNWGTASPKQLTCSSVNLAGDPPPSPSSQESIASSGSLGCRNRGDGSEGNTEDVDNDGPGTGGDIRNCWRGIAEDDEHDATGSCGD